MSEFNINEDAQSGGEFSGTQSSSNEQDSSQPVESAFPDEDEETITMLDVIEREDELEEEASAVLGNSDEKNCTYPKGYISRQALYSCATCSEGTDNFAAICLACSLECHENHEVIELYTKRNFRCDCGNSKFKEGFECKLVDKQIKKLPLNENNKYNHNFSGRYCICDKRYPPEEGDDSAESNDEMWQCIICEDWYHTKHLGTKELPTKFDELICGTCVNDLDFVHYYRDIDKKTCEPLDGEKAANEGAVVEDTSNRQKSVPEELEKQHDATETKKEASGEPVCESDTNDSQAENKAPKHEVPASFSTSSDAPDCLLETLKKEYDSQRTRGSPKKGPIFWADCTWRSKLCRCTNCLSMYKSKECEYLLDDKDTVQYYEAQGKALAQNSESPLERGMSALNRMNRVAVAEALHGYDQLKADLSSYLRKFAATKKVVREEDIHEFFDQLKSKKRPRFDET